MDLMQKTPNISFIYLFYWYLVYFTYDWSLDLTCSPRPHQSIDPHFIPLTGFKLIQFWSLSSQWKNKM